MAIKIALLATFMVTSRMPPPAAAFVQFRGGPGLRRQLSFITPSSPSACGPAYRAQTCRIRMDALSDGNAMLENKLLHAMIKVQSVDQAVKFWEERGATVLNKAGKGSFFVGYGTYRDARFFALELSPTTDAVVSNEVCTDQGTYTHTKNRYRYRHTLKRRHRQTDTHTHSQNYCYSILVCENLV